MSEGFINVCMVLLIHRLKAFVCAKSPRKLGHLWILVFSQDSLPEMPFRKVNFLMVSFCHKQGKYALFQGEILPHCLFLRSFQKKYHKNALF